MAMNESQLVDTQYTNSMMGDDERSFQSSFHSLTNNSAYQYKGMPTSNSKPEIRSSHYMTEPQDVYSVSQKTRTLLNFTQNSQAYNLKSSKNSRTNTQNVFREAQSPEDIIKGHLEKNTIEIEKGKVKENTEEFLKFKSKNFYIWGDIQEVIQAVMRVMKEYGISNIKLLTTKIIRLATFMREPTREELSECIENYEMVIEYSKKRVKDDIKMANIQSKAAIMIQK